MTIFRFLLNLMAYWFGLLMVIFLNWFHIFGVAKGTNR